MPKVSVIIPTYNCAQYISEAMESALAQSYQDFEILIIDDGSTDNIKDVIKGYLDNFPNKVRYIFQENHGLANARNTGIQNAKGEFIALLDADDRWLPDRLEIGVREIEADPTVGLVHANITFMTEEWKSIRTPRRNKEFLSGYIFEHIFLRHADISCPTILFRKECCRQVGVFDENLTRLGCEDRDLWLRIAQKYRFQYVDKILAHYRVRKASMSNNLEKMLKAQLYVIDKYCPSNNGKHLRKKALAKVYRDLGDNLLFRQNFVESKNAYIKSLSYRPFSIWPVINFFKAAFKIRVKTFYTF